VADLRISELLQLTGSNLGAGDFLAVADTSASETRKITVTNFLEAASALIADDTIPSAKILFVGGSIPGSALEGETVDTSQIANEAINAAKLADNSSVHLVAALPAAGDFVGQIALDTDDLKIYCWNGSLWQSIKAAGSVNTIVGGDAGVVNVTTSQVGDTVTINTTLDDTTAASQFLAGPTSSAGATTFRVIEGDDLPAPTTTAKGGVVVNGNGLTLSGSTLAIDNTVTASATNHVVTYNAQGLVTGGRAIQGSDVPVATASTLGVVAPGSGLTVNVSGTIDHSNTVTPGTYEKVTVDAQGHVTAGAELTSADLADVEFSATQITSGTISADRFAGNSISGSKLSNFAVTQIGGASSTDNVVVFPTPDHTGQYFYDSLNSDLYLYDGNAWQPITITAGEIIFAGTFDASAGSGTGLIATLTSAGTALGLSINTALPAAAATNTRYYFVVSTGGTITSGNAPSGALAPPDIILSDGTQWTEINVSSTVAAQTADNINLNPQGSFTGTKVQDALEELLTDKADLDGATFTGNVILDASSLVYDTGTFNTTISAATGTAARTITFPDVTGTVVTTGDTGTVSNTMLAGSIAYSKLATLSSGNIIIGNGSNVATSTAVTGDVTISNTGVTAIASDVIVDADIKSDAAIAFSKLAALSSGNILVGNGSNVAASVAMSGDATLSNAGVLNLATIADSKLATISTAGKVSGSAITSGTIGGTTIINISGAITTSGAVTVTGETTLKEIKETVYTLATSGTTALDPANGSIQTTALSGNITFTDSLETGQSILLLIANDGSYTVTWPTITWLTANGNVAPSLATRDMIAVFKVATTLYGAFLGSYA